ncbi:hypothetical protein FSP39_018686 [Pinctada imbricata]|uniref:Ribonuclease H2 subunit B n=1 Tax=Pinctada imbricata TaxID=66713 RepID=A0AA89BTX8_PINIB|nr:hypothetical protein FSP39_018686 [Pinctada imbricata]
MDKSFGNSFVRLRSVTTIVGFRLSFSGSGETVDYLVYSEVKLALVPMDDVLSTDSQSENQPVFCKLRHPKSDQSAMFLFTHGNREVYEVTSFKEDCRSWFIDNTVQQDGAILMTLPVDPLFLVLPYLQSVEQTGKYMTLDQIVCDEDYPECNRLTSTKGMSELHNIADVKGSDDLEAFRYNEEKTLTWLQCKTEKLADALSDREFCVSGAQSSSYVRSKRAMTSTRDDYVRYAYGMVSDYLPVDLAGKLREHMKMPVVAEKKENEPPTKKAKVGDITPTEDYSQSGANDKSEKVAKLTASQKKLSKVDKTGMKSLASFFSPKAKS